MASTADEDISRITAAFAIKMAEALRKKLQEEASANHGHGAHPPTPSHPSIVLVHEPEEGDVIVGRRPSCSRRLRRRFAASSLKRFVKGEGLEPADADSTVNTIALVWVC